MELFNKLGVEPIQLKAKEGLGLINGTQAMTATGVKAYLRAEKLGYLSEYISSLTFQALEGIIDVFDEEIHISRGYSEQVDVAKRYRLLLDALNINAPTRLMFSASNVTVEVLASTLVTVETMDRCPPT